MFIQEILLSLSLIISLVYSCYLKVQKKDIFLQNKKHFFILINLGIFTLGVIFLLNLIFILFNGKFSTTIYENIIYFSTINQLLANYFGLYLFRFDLLTFALNMFLSFIFIIYMLIIKNILKLSKVEYKYFLELPILLLILFFSLHLFLLTYDLILIVLTLELAAFCSVLLIGLHVSTTKNVFTLEAAIKYFIFSALSGLLLLFAISGYYYFFKTLNIFDFKYFLLTSTSSIVYQKEILLFLHFIFFIAFFLKLGAAPFHFWVPDVYEGAELLITTFLVLIISPTICCKVFFFVKILLPTFELKYSLSLVICLLGLLSIVIGSFKAYQQYKLKRFLAYTSIIHLGYILVSLGTGSHLGFLASFIYLFIYLLTNILLFFVLLLIRQPASISLLFFNQFKMLFSSNIYLLILFLVPLFSFAGFPPFLGFFTKFMVLLSLIDFNEILLALSLICYIVMNSFLYLRFIKLTLFENTEYLLFFPNEAYIPEKYFQLNLSLVQKNTTVITNSGLLFLLFILGIILTLGSLFLPSLIILVGKPLFTLFLYY